MDLDGDGHRDLISGSWPGELFFFKGGPGGTFAAPEMLKDKDGSYINIGGGIEEEEGGGLLITGHADFETTDGKTFVVYHDRRIESTPEKPISVTGTASAVHACDWDGDGDLDLIVGDIRGSVHLVLNEGTAKAWAFGKERVLIAGGQVLRVEGDAGPFVADWDGDGKHDLLVGAGNGSVTLFRNEGTAREPALATGFVLVPEGEIHYDENAPKTAARGHRAKVCAADWNGDGRLDLLVGDVATLKPDRPEPSPEEKVEHDRLRAELEKLYAEYSAAIDRLHGPSRIKDEAERKKAEEEFKALRERMSALQEKLPPEYETHGWVWLFLRK